MDQPLQIYGDVFYKIPGLIVIAGFLKAGTPQIENISSYLKASWEKLGEEVKAHGPKKHPLIGRWRDALKQAGVPLKKCPPSIEAIAKRTSRSDTPFSINPVVDAYNAISMDLVLPFGAYDLDQMTGPLCLRVSDGGEQFTPLGMGAPEETVAGEIVYADDMDILTRHFLWRQADKGKITKDTKHCVFVCEVLETMGESMVGRAVDLIESNFSTLLGGSLSGVCVLR